MEHIGLLLCLQKPAVCPYPDSDKSLGEEPLEIPKRRWEDNVGIHLLNF